MAPRNGVWILLGRRISHRWSWRWSAGTTEGRMEGSGSMDVWAPLTLEDDEVVDDTTVSSVGVPALAGAAADAATPCADEGRVALLATEAVDDEGDDEVAEEVDEDVDEEVSEEVDE